MNISSVVLRAKPAKLATVRAQLAGIPGIEICAVRDDGCVVLTLEDTPHSAMANAYASLHDIDGVVNASLVYQYSDEAFSEEPQP